MARTSTPKKRSAGLVELGSEFSQPVSNFAQPVHTINAEDAVEDAARLMRENQVGSIIVSEGTERDKPIGILTEWDLLSRVAAEGKDVAKTRIREVMSSPLVTIEANARVGDAIRLMINRGIRRLAVIEGGVLVGVVTLNQMVGERKASYSPLPMVEPITGLRCPYCNSTFGLRKQLSKHISEDHVGTLQMLREEKGRPPPTRSKANRRDYAVFEIEETDEE